MHELSVAMSLLDVAAEAARSHGVARVLAIHLRLGPLAGVEKDSLLSAFELAREGTSLGQAALVVEEVPVTIHCRGCGGERPAVSVQQLCCAACGTPSAQVVRGRELQIVALETDT